MQRRKFLQNSFVISGGILLSPRLLANEISKPSKKKRLTILHTNDTHSNIDPFPVNHSKYPGQGGVSKRFELIQKIREQEEHVLLLDAGDIFQGTPYFNKYGGVLEIKLMTEMGYDASTMGNHDFDGGLEGFYRAKQYANFPFLCANYDFSQTILNNVTQRSTIISKGDLKIGIFGVGVELKGLVPPSKYEDTAYYDPIGIANQEAENLKNQGGDLIICLSHLGFEYTDNKVSDKVLARNSKNIHLILGGHTHTFLERPAEEINLEGQMVLINQVGWAGLQLGRLDFEFDERLFSKKDIIQVK